MKAISTEETYTAKLDFDNNSLAQALFGEHSQNLKAIEQELDIQANVRGSSLILKGQPQDVRLAEIICRQLYDLLQSGYPLYLKDVEYAIRILSGDPAVKLKDIFLDAVYITSGRKIITPKSPVQKEYIDAIRKYDMVFGIGPAGTGKTYLAMAMAVSALMKEDVDRVVLARPAVEAGEKLGFLPGDLAEKVNPYLRPLYDALYDMMSFDKATKLLQRGVIEVAPLAFMRGRTLNNAFVILDEAQNTTSEQMKMFLTRLGFGSKAVITGDITQIDLPEGKVSGLVEARKILSHISNIRFVYFSKRDVVRHKLVQEIIQAYEKISTDKDLSSD